MVESTQYATHKERLEILNGKAESTFVTDVIDRPIRQLVLEMNRIGLNTRFSCCGFNYRDEEEPKSHSAKPFVLFKFNPKDSVSGAVGNFFKFAQWSAHMGWTCQMINAAENEWGIVFSIKDTCGWESSDGLPPIHEPEIKITAIQNLTNQLINFPTVCETFEITDGNIERLAKNPEWLVEPKQSSRLKVVNTEQGFEYQISLALG